MGAVIILSTFPDVETARDVSTRMVREGAAACASIIEVASSIYVWEGSMQDSPECMVLFKTTSQNGGRLRELIGQCHPYDTPEIAQIAIEEINHPYMRWLADSVR